MLIRAESDCAPALAFLTFPNTPRSCCTPRSAARVWLVKRSPVSDASSGSKLKAGWYTRA